MDPYEARFTFFWYDDEEIFQDTQEDLDRKLKAVADQGITHIMTFSGTHFRWSFRPWWKELNECLAKIVKAAHKYGIKVIEHHSAELIFYPETQKAKEILVNRMKKHHSSVSTYPGLEEYLLGEDSPAKKDVQIDLYTGKPILNHYGCRSKCYNNPYYIEEYKKYLESVYATGIDGIMTDDIYYVGYCACEHCRKIYKEKFGYEFPPPEKLDSWVGNYADASFVAYQKLRFEATRNFHNAIAAHYKKLGLKLLRPNYISIALCRDWTACGVEMVPELDWLFQEVALGCAIRYTWPKVLAEQTHRAMVAEKREIPHGILFYAFTGDQLLFSWGITMLAGAFYINTPEGSREKVDETRIRNFEKKYSDMLCDAGVLSTVGFLDSRQNRYFSAAYEVNRMAFFMDVCHMNNIPCRMVSSSEKESWENCKILILNEINILSEQEIRDLLAYAASGKSLMISGIPGNQDENGKRRTLAECEKLWGIPLAPPEDSPRITAYGKGKIAILPIPFGCPVKEDALAAFGRDHMEILSTKIPYPLLKNYNFITSGVLKNDPDIPQRLYKGVMTSCGEIRNLLEELAGELDFRTELPEGILAIPFRSKREKGIHIRLLNTTSTMEKAEPDSQLDFSFPIPWKKWEKGAGTILLSLPSDLPELKIARFLNVDCEEISLPTEKTGNQLKITLEPGILKDFGVIRLTEY